MHNLEQLQGQFICFLFGFRSVAFQFDSIERNLNGNLTKKEQEWKGGGSGTEPEWNENGIGTEKKSNRN